jgi:spermidine synthase
LAVTGLLGIGYEVVVVRVLSQVSENTVYTFAMLLAVYLVGTAAGAAVYQRWSGRQGDPTNAQDLLLSALATACLLSTAALWGAEHIKAFALEVLGGSMAAAIAGEAVLAVVAFAPPTVVMGALFSHLCSRANTSGVSFGRALAINTLGATGAPLVFGLLVLPALGAKAALLLLGAGYLALTSWSRWRSLLVWAPAGAAAALALLAPRLVFVEVPDGGRIVSYREGVMGAVSVVEDAEGILRLRIDNRQQEGSSATLRVDGRQGLLPVFLHPAPQRALFLGMGTGVTSSTAAQDPTLKVEVVELLPEVIEAASLFTSNTRLQPIAADARRYVRASEERYDVIVSDNFHPARSGSGSLYTVEHFAAVRDRLAADGVFCQWLPLHQLDLQTFRSIVRSFLAVYPQGSAMLASNSLETPVIGLVGRADGKHFDIDALHARLASGELAELRGAIGIEDEYALLGSFIAGPRSLARFAANASLNTDDHPVVAYSAPRVTYSPDSTPRDRLFTLLADSTVESAELIGPAQESTPAARLTAYWKARNEFIQSGRNIRPSSDVRVMLAQVREPLLTSLRLSPDFRPAYDPLLRMAVALSQSDPPAARELLGELMRLQPARPEAGEALNRGAAEEADLEPPGD